MNPIIKINKQGLHQSSTNELVEFIRTQSELGFDVETTGLDWTKEILVSYAIGTFEEQYTVDHRLTDIAVSRSILLELTDKKVIMHNALFDLSVLKTNVGINFYNIEDTFQTETTLTKGATAPKSYQALVSEYCGVSLSKDERLEFGTLGEASLSDTQILYMANDVKYLLPIHKKQLDVKESYKDVCFSNLLFEIDNSVIPAVVDMQTHGVRYDVDGHNENLKLIKKERDKLYHTLISTIKKHFLNYNLKGDDYAKAFKIETEEDIDKLNLSSPVQLLTLFKRFDDKIKKTGVAILNKYILNGKNEDLKEIISLLLEYRQKEKLITTYGEGFLKGLVTDSNNEKRLVTNIQTNMTTTGRLTSGDMKESYVNNKGTLSSRKLGRFVNLQNLPRDPKIRALFLPELGEEMVTIDLDSCELRILAAKSKDPKLIAGVSGHLDLHSAMATMSYRIIHDDPDFVVSKKKNAHLRTLHKRVLFGLLYGAGPARVAEVLNIKQTLAKKVYLAIREYLSVAFDYLDREVTKALKQGYCILNNVTKRTIFLEDYAMYKKNGLIHPNSHRIKRQIYNALMQATNADMLKLSLRKINDFFRDILCGKIKLSVYDEIVYSRPKGHEWIDEVVKDIIISTCNMFLSEDVEMQISYEVAPYWVK